jgi:hypothetical protein
MMNRGYLALGAALVVVVVIALYVAIASSDDDELTAVPRDPKIAEVPRDRPTGSIVRTPSASGTPERTAGTAADAPKEYVVGGVRIRDHRKGEHVQLDVPPSIHPPGGRKLPSELTNAIAQQVRAAVNECAASVPAEARGDKPRMDGEIQIAIKDRQARVTSATIQPRDITGSVEQVKQCVEQRAVGIASPSGDEADLEGYSITLSIRLP